MITMQITKVVTVDPVRLGAIAMKWLPRDPHITVDTRPSRLLWSSVFMVDTEWSDNDEIVRQTLIVPEPDNLDALYVWIHECGHVRLRHAERDVFHHVAEFEAEEFAHVVFSEEGLEVPERMTQNAETNVRINLMKDMLLYGFGCAIDPRVMCWLVDGGHKFNKEMK